ncbi:MAG: helix-turn-helix transcriptional regulator [Treponema sp.]|nr:helix-turn-helix transcriptional regulator [Treponema sp.]
MEQFNLGTRVEQILIQRSITPTDFCKEMGVSHQNYYDWKKKGATPNAMTALKVAQYLGVTVEYLLTGKDFVALQTEQIKMSEINYKRKYEALKKSVIKAVEDN